MVYKRSVSAAVASSNAAAAANASSASDSPVQGPQPEFAAALMSVLADDFPTTVLGRKKK
jgi:hypothetical protein